MAHFFTFFEIYTIFTLSHRSFADFFREISTKFAKIRKIRKILTKNDEFSSNFEFGAVRKRENLVDLEKCEKNAPFLAIVAVDTAENELRKKRC